MMFFEPGPSDCGCLKFFGLTKHDNARQSTTSRDDSQCNGYSRIGKDKVRRTKCKNHEIQTHESRRACGRTGSKPRISKSSVKSVSVHLLRLHLLYRDCVRHLLQRRLHVYKPRFHWGFARFYRLQIVYIVVYRTVYRAEAEPLMGAH